MNPLIFICLIGVALGMTPRNVEVPVFRTSPSVYNAIYNPLEVHPRVPVVQSNPSVYKPVYTGEVHPGVPGVQTSPSVYNPVYHPLNGVPTHGAGYPYKVVGISTPFLPYVFIPVSTVEGGHIAYDPHTSRKTEVDTKAFDCPFPFCW